jgi:Bacteriophage baseplate protein W
MSRDFLGVGWNFPIGPDSHRQIGMAHDDQCVHNAIWMILGTAPGERVMRPDFGCGIYDMVFEVGSTSTTERIANLVRQALVRWEPRIDLLSVTAARDADTPAVLLIQIEYRVRTTNNRFNLVYPFYLE